MGPTLAHSDDVDALPETERRCVRLLLTLRALTEVCTLAKGALGAFAEASTETSTPSVVTTPELAAFAHGVASALRHTEKLRTEIGQVRERPRLVGRGAHGAEGEPLHVFTASAFASLYDAADSLIEVLCPPAAKASGLPPSGRTQHDPRIRGVAGHLLPLLESLVGCITVLLLLLKDELPSGGLVSKALPEQRHLEPQQRQPHSPLSRGWFFGSIFGLCMHMGSRTIDCCLTIGQPDSASLTGLMLAALQLISGGATAAWPLQYESHRLRSGSKPGAPNTTGVFRRCFAAPVPMCGGLPSGAVCGIAGHELLLLLQCISGGGNSADRGGYTEVTLWALRCLYAIAGCFCFVAEARGGPLSFSLDDAVAARDGALRLYPMIAASLVGMLLGTLDSGSSSSAAPRPRARKVACAAALALRQWMRAALEPLPPAGEPVGVGAAAAETTAAQRLAQLQMLLKSEGSLQGGPCAIHTTPRTERLRELTKADEESKEIEGDEVTPESALEMLLSPAPPATRRRAAVETARRLQVIHILHSPPPSPPLYFCALQLKLAYAACLHCSSSSSTITILVRHALCGDAAEYLDASAGA